MSASTGRPALSLTRLGLGGAQFGNLYREMSDATAAATFAAAWAHGIRYFDTAPHYGLGLSERRLGALLRGQPRESYILSTKVGRLLVANPMFAGEQDPEGFAVPARTRRQWDFSRDGVRRSIDESLQRLGSGLLALSRPGPRATYDYRPAPPDVIERVHAIADVCERHGVALPQAALAFAVRPAAVRSVVVGAETPDQVTEAARRLARPVPEALWSALAAAKLTSGGPPRRRREERSS